MKTLVQNLAERRAVLHEQLQSAKGVKEVVRVLQDELSRLADLEGEYMRQLTVSPARVAKPMLEFLRASLSTMTPVEFRWPINEERVGSNVYSAPLGSSVFEPDQIFVVVIAALGAFVAGPFGAGVGAGLSTVGVRSIKRYADPGGKPALFESESDVKPPNPVDTSALLSYLEQALSMIDQAVAAVTVQPVAVPTKPSLTDHRDVLEFFQNLLGDSMDEQAQLTPALRLRIKEISRLLHRSGIRAVNYAPDPPNEDVDMLFDFEASIDPATTEYVTLTPALVKDNNVLLRGRVVEPAQKPPDSGSPL